MIVKAANHVVKKVKSGARWYVKTRPLTKLHSAVWSYQPGSQKELINYHTPYWLIVLWAFTLGWVIYGSYWALLWLSFLGRVIEEAILNLAVPDI